MKTRYQLRTNQIKSNQIDVNIEEVLRYLQYKSNDIDEETLRVLKESILEIKEISELRYVYRIIDIDKNDTSISFNNEFSINSKDLSKLFKASDKVAVLASTLGLAVEKRIRYYSITNLSKAVIFDACATTYIEALCDYIEEEIREIAKEENCGITFRFSPGYGDVPISHQGDILRTLNATKLIGLNASESSILIPRKSVTVFIGLDKSNTTKSIAKSCKKCNLFKTCTYSKEGGNCGK